MTPAPRGHTFPDHDHLLLALEAGRMGTWSWNAITNDVQWDDAMEARYGVPQGEFDRTFESFLDRVHPDDRQATIEAIIHAQESGEPLAFEHRVLWPDGTIHWIEARGRAVTSDDGDFIGMVGIGLDIDDRKQFERLRHDAELRMQLEDAQRIARIGSWRWDRAGNEVTLSTEMRRQLDIEGPLTGADLRQLIEERAHPDDTLRVRETQSRSTQQVQPFSFEHRIVVRNEIRHVVHRGEVLRDDEGEVVGLRGTTQDVTDRRRAEEALLATRERLMRERRAVDVLHEALIRPEFPEVPGVEIAARYLSAEVEADIGGDWYDAFALPDGRAMLVVGDVSGHGIRAARLMAKLRHTIRGFAVVEPRPDRVIESLDRFLAHFSTEEEFATVQVAALDHRTGEVELVSAGHPAPVIVDADGARFVEVTNTRVLGVTLSPLVTNPHRFVLEPGTALLFYTDGLVERRGADPDSPADGFTRVTELSLATTGDTADEVCDAALAHCLGDANREDDVCVLVALRRLG
jgi:PAS domain S-box-containing protein